MEKYWITIVDKVKIFLFNAGKVIIAISIVLWFLSSRGPGENFAKLETEYEKLAANPNSDLTKLNQLQAEKLENSYSGKMGKLVEPAIAPLGFDWKIGIALVTSFAAREVFVGTMSTIYSVGKDNGNENTVRDKMMSEKNEQWHAALYIGSRHITHVVLRIRHAMHEHHGCSKTQNRKMEMAHSKICRYMGGLA